MTSTSHEYRSGVIVVDDKEDDGIRISTALWKNGWPALFVHYDPENLVDGALRKSRGIRAVFLDLDLMGSGTESGFHGQAQSAINAVLHEDNGPYVLVTWTSHARYSEEVFEKLKTGLAEGLQPIDLKVLDKDRFLADQCPHEELVNGVRDCFSEIPTLMFLLDWEHEVQQAASQAIHLLKSNAPAIGGSDPFAGLRLVIETLSVGYAGTEHSVGKDISSYVYAVLSSLIGDLTDRMPPISFPAEMSPNQVRSDAQKYSPALIARINTMLKFDLSSLTHTTPGAVAPFTSDLFPLSVTPDKFIRKHFLTFKKDEKKNREEISNSCCLVMMDITPPCDHSQGKTVFRRFILGIRLKLEHIEFCYRISRKDGKESRMQNQYNGQFMWCSPVFQQEGESFVFLFNANLVFSLELSDNIQAFFGRLREQIFQDFLGWLGRHLSRAGHVSL